MNMSNTLQSTVSQKEQAAWPELLFAEWEDTGETLHMWTQVVGKIMLALNPYVNHWWHVALHLTPSGLTTGPIPFAEGKMFKIQFDFLHHNLHISTNDDTAKILPLYSRSVADFYHEVMASLHTLGIDVRIFTLPQEVPNPIRFEQDTVHATYNPELVTRFWRILLQIDSVLRPYRAHFIGKSSPIHFFWGSFDLALTFFSGRPAPARPGADPITQEAYSHEVISAGFWPGDHNQPGAAFYLYAAPVPQGLETTKLAVPDAYYDQKLGEFILPYSKMRSTASPAQTLQAFYQQAYEAAANAAHWDRTALEKH